MTACSLYDSGGVRYTACSLEAGTKLEEVCDGDGGCLSGKICTQDTIEVAHAYRLRICR